MLQIMFLLCLLTCLALRAFNAQAKVVNSFNECQGFFYDGIEPQGMDQNAVKICQKLEKKPFCFATLYSGPNKIPLYSAYKFDLHCLPKQVNEESQRCNQWHIEPQIKGPSEPDHMIRERTADNFVEQYKTNQALIGDYENTGYDRGHLNPHSYQCGDDNRKATFTLTNAAPMDPYFNQNHWKNWEGYLLSFLKDKLQSDNAATAYIVTGAVPGDDRIPQNENCGGSGDSRRVTVPTHIWTAVCYKHHYDNTQSFSFGYIGRNQQEFNITVISISDMNQQLSELYGKHSRVQIFVNDCFGDKQVFEKTKSTFLNKIKLLEHRRLQMFTDAQNNFFASLNVFSSSSEILSAQGAEITGLTATVVLKNYFNSSETLKKEAGSACLLTAANTLVISHNHDELRKKEVSEESEFVECRLVPEQSVDRKTAADGLPCDRHMNDDYTCTCYTPEGKSKSCCSTPCLYHDSLKGYWCYSGKTQIQCSPQYSLITAEGKRCRDDHPCATYGEDYYWCYTDSTSWEYCSPPLWGSRAKGGKKCRRDFACAKYNKRNPWCYTDNNNNWDYCCTSDDCFSAVNYKTCKPDHPCGYHGKNYLWCSTTDNSWNYCCKNCSL